jgi:hydrogenase-1 operon protein HyaE
VRPDSVEAFENEAGDAVLFFGGDPVRFPEALDVAVVLPELQAPSAMASTSASCRAEVEDQLARRYAVQRWPSLVFLRDGGYLGMVAGMKDWDDYLREVQACCARARTPAGRRPPSPSTPTGAACHCR